RITLKDSADDIAVKIRKAQTDPDPLPLTVEGLEGRAGADNLVGIYAALSGLSKAEVLAKFDGAQFSVFKPALAELAVDKLSPITTEMKRMLDHDQGYIDDVLASGAERARAIADPIYKRVREIVGFI
ncbi:MAG TPA: tryptophan--tRNA ligase, partial [Parvibaculum sp.]|nr:tryptophan--tRNA ligase [Parvibaculum sp.]